MTTSSRLHAGDTSRRRFAVFVGLANLAFLAVQGGVDLATFQRRDVGLNEILLPVLAVVAAGLATPEIVLRLRQSALTEKFSRRYSFSVSMICLGGTLMGFLLAAAHAINRVLVPGPNALIERVFVSLMPGFVGAAFGLALGLVEGLVLAFPLAAVLGRFRDVN